MLERGTIAPTRSYPRTWIAALVTANGVVADGL